jgi:hypothetical protein
MADRYPNRVADACNYNATSLVLRAAAPAGRRSFAAAVSAGKLAAGDRVIVSLESSTNPDRWAIWSALVSVDAGVVTLTVDAVEDSATNPPQSGEDIRVEAVITGAALARFAAAVRVHADSEQPDATHLRIFYTGDTQPEHDATVVLLEAPVPNIPATNWDGPDYWDIVSSTTTWDATNGWYLHNSYTGVNTFQITPTLTGAEAGWETGDRPVNLSLEVYIPADASLDAEYISLRVYHNEDADYVDGDGGVGGGNEGTWVTLTCSNLALDLTSDISSLRLIYIPSAGTEAGCLYRVRNIVFTDA